MRPIDRCCSVLVVLGALFSPALVVAQCELPALTDPASGDNFGWAVSGSGDLLAVGSAGTGLGRVALYREDQGDWILEQEYFGYPPGDYVAGPIVGSRRSFVHTYGILYSIVSWQVKRDTGWESLVGYKALYPYGVGDSLFAGVGDGHISIWRYDHDTGTLSSGSAPFFWAGYDTQVSVSDNRVFVSYFGETTVFEEVSGAWQEHSSIADGAGSPSPDGTRYSVASTIYRINAADVWEVEAMVSGGVVKFDSDTRLLSVDSDTIRVYDLITGTWTETVAINASTLSVPGILDTSRVALSAEQLHTGRPGVSPSGAVLHVALECPPVEFIRGDCNGLGGIEIADAVTVLNYLFNGTSPSCLDACDYDDSGSINLVDPIRMLLLLFESGPVPADPFPACGSDATDDDLPCVSSLTCP